VSCRLACGILILSGVVAILGSFSEIVAVVGVMDIVVVVGVVGDV
jgi:hypothetical protein